MPLEDTLGRRSSMFAIFHPAYRQCKETACAGCQIGGEEYMRDGNVHRGAILAETGAGSRINTDFNSP